MVLLRPTSFGRVSDENDSMRSTNSQLDQNRQAASRGI